jgi:hypothetical protein
MKSKIKLCFILITIFVAINLYSFSDGALNVSGAPGEGDCSGCHAGKVLNSVVLKVLYKL